jgi:hypothetical protein
MHSARSFEIRTILHDGSVTGIIGPGKSVDLAWEGRFLCRREMGGKRNSRVSGSTEGATFERAANKARPDNSFLFRYLKVKEPVRSINQSQSDQGDEDFANSADGEWPPTLLAQFAEVGAQAYTREGQQKGPSGEIRET